jgi:hypothetical protein
MLTEGQRPEDDQDDGPGSNVRQIVAALILLAGLVVVGLWLSGTLRSAAQIQDCVAGGRTNCAPITR